MISDKFHTVTLSPKKKILKMPNCIRDKSQMLHCHTKNKTKKPKSHISPVTNVTLSHCQTVTPENESKMLKLHT
jgi:hypothetical protein